MPRSNKSLHAQITERAYQLWEKEGHPHGREIDHWLAAEQEVSAAQNIKRLPRKSSAPRRKAARPGTRRTG